MTGFCFVGVCGQAGGGALCCMWDMGVNCFEWFITFLSCCCPCIPQAMAILKTDFANKSTCSKIFYLTIVILPWTMMIIFRYFLCDMRTKDEGRMGDDDRNEDCLSRGWWAMGMILWIGIAFIGMFIRAQIRREREYVSGYGRDLLFYLVCPWCAVYQDYQE